MPAWPNLFQIGRFRFNARVGREVTRREHIYGEDALARVLADLQRPDLRSHYREMLQVVAERLRRKSRKTPPTPSRLIAQPGRSKARQSSTSNQA